MLRIDMSDRRTGVLILIGFGSVWVLRILAGYGTGLSVGFLAMAGLPLLVCLAALFLRLGDGEAERSRKALAFCAAGAAYLGCMFQGVGSNEVLLWLYSLLVAVALAIWSSALEETAPESVGDGQEGRTARRSGMRARWQLVAVICGVTAASLGYRWLTFQQLEQTSALFIGVPALLAVAVALTGPPRSAMGTALKATVVGLLLSSVLLSEGLVCIIMAAPLFLAVAALCGRLVDQVRTRRRESIKSAMLLLALLPMSLEGVLPELSFSRDESVTVTRVMPIGADQVRINLEQTPDFAAPLPNFLRLGFPRPVSASGAGLEPGDSRTIRFAGGEGNPGDLTLEVAEAEDLRVVFHAISDQSHIAHWLDWHEAEVVWTELASGETEVSWTLRYSRLLDPAWYFGPWERYGVSLAGEYLLETIAGKGR